LQLYQLKPSYP